MELFSPFLRSSYVLFTGLSEQEAAGTVSGSTAPDVFGFGNPFVACFSDILVLPNIIWLESIIISDTL